MYFSDVQLNMTVFKGQISGIYRHSAVGMHMSQLNAPRLTLLQWPIKCKSASLGSVFGLSLLSYCRKMALQQGGLCGRDNPVCHKKTYILLQLLNPLKSFTLNL